MKVWRTLDRKVSLGPATRRRSGSSKLVAEVHRAAVEAALVEQLELDEGACVREGTLATADEDGDDEQLELVDEPGLDRLGR